MWSDGVSERGRKGSKVIDLSPLFTSTHSPVVRTVEKALDTPPMNCCHAHAHSYAMTMIHDWNRAHVYQVFKVLIKTLLPSQKARQDNNVAHPGFLQKHSHVCPTYQHPFLEITGTALHLPTTNHQKRCEAHDRKSLVMTLCFFPFFRITVVPFPSESQPVPSSSASAKENHYNAYIHDRSIKTKQNKKRTTPQGCQYFQAPGSFLPLTSASTPSRPSVVRNMSWWISSSLMMAGYKTPTPSPPRVVS